jgi:hypothetical protein
MDVIHLARDDGSETDASDDVNPAPPVARFRSALRLRGFQTSCMCLRFRPPDHSLTLTRAVPEAPTLSYLTFRASYLLVLLFHLILLPRPDSRQGTCLYPTGRLYLATSPHRPKLQSTLTTHFNHVRLHSRYPHVRRIAHAFNRDSQLTLHAAPSPRSSFQFSPLTKPSAQVTQPTSHHG